ncbi:GrpB family protein [Pseudoalteromonas luteoviolacea]|uniref:GrpB family protein n=1 Tax=Pseudoalteromonas luteoviolacea (strain 2ta16) TaxID=1353533 RepID=V4HNQ2_PSEL2|nr:GrpB family protein [Pseudoalteromonas luteoviolacea]ESP92430.1 hypothetical protein PL2TA16_04238 [Pseudoalteromonas luteoviolacea 2ta16]KZN34990.1 hypothetical protein N483_23905 [Pseudoalteromonas luteoviolacea NCIMB 1944]
MKIELFDYDPTWPDKFELERKRLHSVLAPWLFGSIEHVGSTAISDMIAKPIIDIMVGVKSLNGSRGAIEALCRHGYCYYPYKPEQMHWFCTPSPTFRTHHVHLIPYRNALWFERLNFRDKLRGNQELADQYAQLKLSLVQKKRDDREAYTREKWLFIQNVLEL